MIFNKLYDWVALRHDRYIENCNTRGGRAAERRKRKNSRRSVVAVLALIAGIAISAILVINLLAVLPLFTPISLTIAACSFIDVVMQACFMSGSFGKRFVNRKLCPITLTSTLLMVLAWTQSAIGSVLTAPYYLLKDLFAKTKHFDDIVNRRGAVGRCIGTVLVGGVVAAVAIGLLANPFTGLPILALVGAISATIALGFLIIKICEFIGKLSGALKTKALADQAIAEETSALAAQVTTNVNERKLTLQLHTRDRDDVRSKIFNDLFAPSDIKNRKSGASVIKEASGSVRKLRRTNLLNDTTHTHSETLTHLDRQKGISLEQKIDNQAFKACCFYKGSELRRKKLVNKKLVNEQFTNVVSKVLSAGKQTRSEKESKDIASGGNPGNEQGIVSHVASYLLGK